MHPGKILKSAAAGAGERPAVIQDERVVSYAELLGCAWRLAVRLGQTGTGRGDAVVIFLPNSPEFVVAYFASMLIGGVAAPVDARVPGRELAIFMEQTRARAVVTLPSLRPVVADAISRLSFDVEVFVEDLSGESRLAVASVDQIAVEEVSGDDDALYLGTSGTTGKAGVVVLTYSQLGLFPEAMERVLGMRSEDVAGMILPMSHISGPIVCNVAAKLRLPIVLLDASRPEKALSTIEEHKVTWVHGVPSIFQVFLRLPKEQHHKLKSLRFIAMMGTVVPVPLIKEFSRQFPHIAVIQGYGATELSPLVALLATEDAVRKVGSVGRPVPGCRVKVVDEQGIELMPGQIGEIIVSGPQVMKGYLNRPDLTAEVIKDGWYYTRDAGYFDDEGYLYVIGRKDDVVITGGLNVHPGEVENVLLEHPFVMEAAAFGVPHKLRGTILHAAVVLKPNSHITEAELIGFCRQRLAEFKVPRQVQFVESLPRTRMGKIDRQALSAQA